MDLDNNLRSIMFAFKSRGMELFTDPDNAKNFLIMRLMCSKCDAFFHTNLSECYICGEINYYLLRCKKCNIFKSITGSSRMCRNCHPAGDSPVTLTYQCVNDNCVSNTDPDFRDRINNSKGVFNRGNGWNIIITVSY